MTSASGLEAKSRCCACEASKGGGDGGSATKGQPRLVAGTYSQVASSLLQILKAVAFEDRLCFQAAKKMEVIQCVSITCDRCRRHVPDLRGGAFWEGSDN